MLSVGLLCFGALQRTAVGVMMSGQGATADVWAATAQYAKQRQRRAEAQALAARRTYSKAQYDARKYVLRLGCHSCGLLYCWLGEHGCLGGAHVLVGFVTCG